MKRSPRAAFWLSLIPGIGHVYLGQINKGVVLILLAGSMIQITSHGGDGFGILIPFVWLFAMLDAYRSAQEINRSIDMGVEPAKQPPLVLSSFWGWTLVVLGGVFLLDNMGILRFEWIWDLWPLGLIALGAYILRKKPEPIQLSAPPPPQAPAPGIDDAEPEVQND